tara:strand:- start:368 stop:1219 length:852 start_codon:yes stop_codon:yes gene_type:complete
MYEVDRVLIAKSKNNNKNLFSKFWNYLKKKIPFRGSYVKESKFSGWGLEVKHSKPPWEILQKETDLNFLETNNRLLRLINEKEFRLTQFEYIDTNYKKILNELKWRHYIIYNCALDLCQSSNKSKKTLVECGVCDGLTFFYIASAFKFKDVNFNGFLYDSWSKFSFNDEKDIFDYSYLNVDIAKKNLYEFKKDLIFNEGNIPEVFNSSSNPTSIDLLHIDLNSKEATQNSLEFFYEKVSSGGIVIFDDYGRINYEKEVIDKFFINKKGNFVSLPTGQAIFFKK